MTGAKRILRKALAAAAFMLVLCMTLPLFSPTGAAAAGPFRKTLQIGLNYGSGALPSANLVNAAGSGFEFGFYDGALNFHPVASTTETRISIMPDRNLHWNPGGSFSGQYELGENNGLGATAPGALAIGCAHLQLNSGREDMAQAMADIAAYPDGFVRYNLGSPVPYMPMIGNYTTSAEAASRGIGIVDTGTAATITVAVLGTDRIIFEFDNAADRSLVFGIRPIGFPVTPVHYRGEQYTGGFRYDRRDPAALTVVNIIGLEEYVQGVVPYEMVSSWPIEALKAQAICARTYALAQLNKHSAHGFDLCNTADCQVYRGRVYTNAATDAAVTETAGKVVTYGGALISTFYSSSHGGGSENNENIWAGDPLPYLRGVLDDYESAVASSISNYNWILTISQNEITQRVISAGYPNASQIMTLQVSQYSPTGNVISVIAADSNNNQYTFSRRGGLQALFGASALRSQRFNIGDVSWSLGNAIYVNDPPESVNNPEYGAITDSGTSGVSGSMVAIDGTGNLVIVVGGGDGTPHGNPTPPSGGNFVLTGTGWGHSIGMSQWGAYSMALHYGRSAEQIIKHYFTGVEIINS